VAVTGTTTIPPGGGPSDVTVTGVTTTTPGGNTGPKPTTTSVVEANMAGRSALTEGGLLAGLFAAVLGLL